MRTRLLVISAATLAAATFGLSACSSTDAPTPQAAAASVAAPAAPQRVDANAFASFVASPGVTTIDVRTPAEFSAGHIEGAVNYDVQGPDFATQVAALDPTGTYAVYCHSGNRSQAAVAAMTQAGINGIVVLENGIAGWQEAGLPVVS
jgi:rhodanese-related sulfurtransferase